MAGILEEGVKTAGGVVDALRAQPLQLANIVLNIAFLIFLFYYVSIIATRAQNTVNALFVANDKMYTQWATVLKDQQGLTEKVMHCILPEDAIKLLQLPPRQFVSPEVPLPPSRPIAPLEQPTTPPDE